MTFQEFLEEERYYVDAKKSKETDTSYVIVLKGKYYFYHWTPQTSYSKKSIAIDKSEWRGGLAGNTIMEGFYNLSSSGKLATMTGVCSERSTGDDYLVLSPSAFQGTSIDWLNYSWVQDFVDAYDPKFRKAHRKTDDSAKQRPAGIGATRSKKILSVSQFDKFAKSKRFNAKFADTEKFVSFMFKYSKDLFGRSSLKGMSWTAIYNLNPNSADWIAWSKIDTDDFLEYVKQYSRKTK
jgi:hypothetical protein